VAALLPNEHGPSPYKSSTEPNLQRMKGRGPTSPKRALVRGILRWRLLRKLAPR
jgi:hypothetical protein